MPDLATTRERIIMQIPLLLAQINSCTCQSKVCELNQYLLHYFLQTEHLRSNNQKDQAEDEQSEDT